MKEFQYFGLTLAVAIVATGIIASKVSADELVAASSLNSSGFTQIWRIDQSTESRTLLANISLGSGLRPNTFAVTPEFAFASSAQELIVRADLVNGQVAVLGQEFPQLLALATNAGGELFALSRNGNGSSHSIWRVSKESGSRTLVSTFDSGSNFYEDSFAISGSSAFMATSNLDLFRINLVSGVVTQLRRLPDWTTSLVTRSDGALFALRSDYFQFATLFTVDTETGNLQEVRSFQLPLSVYGATVAVTLTEVFLNTPNERLVRVDLVSGVVAIGSPLPSHTSAMTTVSYLASDLDSDGISDSLDNCPAISNPTQADCNSDGIGDACAIAGGAPDFDGDGVPDSCECIGDLFVDGQINGADLGALLSQWGPATAATASDLNRDGQVNGADLGYLLSGWGPCGN